MATLKKLTRVGADVRQIARLLQAKAPEGHMLAYITPEEAELLKSQGGSGKEHADTGIPSFEVDDYSFSTPMESYAATHQMPAESDYAPTVTPTPSVSAPSETTSDTKQYFDPTRLGFETNKTTFLPAFGTAPLLTALREAQYEQRNAPPVDMTQYTGAFPVGSFETQPGTSITPYQIDTTPPKTLSERYDELAKGLGISKETLGRLGIAGAGALYNAYQTKKAQDEARKTKEEQQALAAPYRTKGAELQRQAQAGELTPVGQQQLQAVQAQAAQQAAGRGGAVSAAQTQAQIEAFRNQLLQQQYDYGLKLSGIGDNIALGAIKTGLEADRYVQQLSNNFYTNMANIVGGMPAQTPQQYRSA